MPRIRFTADPKLPRDLAHLGYRKDTEVDLTDDQADRWLRRGVAIVIPDEEKSRRGDKPQTDTLYGSSTLPGLIEIGDERVQLGTVVAAAHQRSGLSVDEWNALTGDDRDGKLNAEIETMRSAAAAPAEIPDGWQDQHHMQRIALARRLMPDQQIDTAADADAAIEAEVERRAAGRGASEA